MLDDKDIQKLIKAQEEVFATKLDFDDFREEYKKDFIKLTVMKSGFSWLPKSLV